MSVHNFPKKFFVELAYEADYGDFDSEYNHFYSLGEARIGAQVATYELVSVGEAAVKLNKIKPEETL